MGTSKTIPINLEVTASLEGMNKVISDLQRGIKEGSTKLDLNKGIGSQLSKLIASFEKDYAKIQRLTADDLLNLGDSKEFLKTSNHLITTFEELQRIVGNFNTLSIGDAKKFFPASFDKRVDTLKKNLNELGANLDQLSLKSIDARGLEQEIANLEKEIQDLKDEASKEAQLKIDSDLAQERLDKAKEAVEAIKASLKEAINLKIEAKGEDIKKAEARIKEIEEKRAKRASTKDITQKGKGAAKYKGATETQWRTGTGAAKNASAQQRTAAIKVIQAYDKETAELEALRASIKQTKADTEKLRTSFSQIEKTDLTKVAKDLGQETDEIDKVSKALQEQADAAEKAEKANKDLASAQKAAGRADEQQASLDRKRNKAEALNKQIEQLTQKVDVSELEKAFKELDIDFSPQMLENQESINKLQSELERLDQEDFDNLVSSLEQLGLNTDKVQALLQILGIEIDKVGEEFVDMTRAQKDLENLKEQILDFFSLSNTIQIFKDAIRGAFDTVKELDAAMTETAVVTDFSIGDMWDKLPEYASKASELGTSIKSLYEATTLYYQQGLQTTEAMDVGIETMKMARIANMDAADATEAMTAALRGFNMEINEISATRVNDVYSELAAITASDTQQIATAMTKTASIAASANMEFETTAALLAQIIETTQEAPETAGTAMKTIIARFTEVKEMFDKGMLSGEDTEGEEININKIDAALKTVGISLKDFLNGTKGIDDIFLELASKWDSLDLATQRYIATTAAGSRQQSRFIAMMSDYGRTMELVNAANNSSGASTEQFNKTLESLDAKLQRLRNAWQEFVMGLANSDLIKTAVDILTELLEKINEITGSSGNDFITFFLRLGTILAGLKGGEAILKGILSNFVKLPTEDMGIVSAILTEIQDKIGIFGDVSDKIGEATKVLGNFVKYLKLLPLLLAGAAVGLVVYSAYQDYQGVDKTKQLEDLNAELKKAQEEAEEAKNELSEIISAQKGFENLEKSFENLIEGTSEWKQALVEVNEQVLELIEKYPGLKLTISDSGAFSIDDSSWDEALANQQEYYNNRVAASTAIQRNIDELQKEMDVDNYTVSNYVANSENLSMTKEAAQKELNRARFLDSNFSILDHEFGITWGELFQGAMSSSVGIANAYGSVPTDVFSEIAKNQEIINRGGYEKDFREKANLTIPDDALESIAKAFYENDIRLADGLDSNEKIKAEQIFEILSSQIDGITTSFDGFIGSVEKTGTTFDLIGSQLINYESQLDAYNRQFTQTSLANSETLQGKDINTLSNIIQNQVDYEKLIDDAIVQIEEKSESSQKSIAQMYAEATGKYFDVETGKTYEDKTKQVPVTISEDDMKEALAAIDVSKILRQVGENMYANMTKYGVNRDLTKKVFDVEGAALDEETLTKYVKDGLIDIDSIMTDFGFQGEDAAKQFVETFGTNALDLIEENFNYASDRILKQRTGLVKKIRKLNYSLGETTDVDYAVKALEKIESFGFGTREAFESILTQLAESGDAAIEIAGYDELMKLAETEGTTLQDFKDIESLMNSINWNNPIEAASRLNKEITEGSELTSDYAKRIKEVGSSSIGAGAQIKQLLRSSEYEDLQEDIKEVIAEQKELSAMDVLDLADSYDVLNDVMDNTGSTAAGLAEILESVANGVLNIEDVDDVVVAAMSGLKSLDTYVAQTIKKVESQDWGLSENSVNEMISDVFEEVFVPNIESGKFNNNQLNNAMNYIRGAGWDEGMTWDQEVQAKVATGKALKKMVDTEDFSTFYAAAAKGKNLWGETASLDPNADYGNLKVVANADGSYGITGYEGITDIKVIEQYLADYLDVSEEFAAQALVDLRQQTDSMDEYFSKIEVNEGVAAMMEAAKTAYTTTTKDPETGETKDLDVKVIDQKQLDIIRQQYEKQGQGEAFDAEVKLRQESGELQITNFYDEKGVIKETEDLMSEVNKVMSKSLESSNFDTQWISNFTKEVEDGLVVDYDTLKTQLVSSGIPEYISDQVMVGILNGYEKASGKELKLQTSAEDGTPLTVDVEPNMVPSESFAKELGNVNTTELENTITAAIQRAFGVEEIALNPNAASLNSLTEAINGAIDAADNSVGVYYYAINNLPALKDQTVTVKYKFGGFVDPYVEEKSKDEGMGSSASGIANALSSHTSLVGELGPELIWSGDRAYLAGESGPEIAQIKKGDTVYTAEQTKDIFKKRNHKIFSSYVGGKENQFWGYGQGVNITGGGSGGKSGSGSSKEEDVWENPFDKLYNLLRKIDEELRERERIERRYEKLLEGIDASANKIIKISREELVQLEKERMLQEQLVTGRKYQIDEYQKENADLKHYAAVTENERGESVLRIDWDLIDQVTDTDQGERIEAYVNQLEEWFDTLEEAEDALWEIEDTVEEIKERGKDEYFDLEEAIKEALTQFYQEEIDTLNTINTSINDTNSSLLDAVQKSIDKQRQDRENDRTERELAEKQRRLAYLQQDTSGANALEILKLQEEIAEGQEDYTDTLIDQKISELQEQNEEAAKQREQQITLLQTQLDHYLEMGGIWEEVYALIDEGLDRDTGLVRGSTLESLLKNAEGFAGLSAIGQMEWLKETNSMIAQALAYLEVGRQLEDVGITEGSQIEFVTKDGKTMTGTVDAKGNVVGADGKTYNNVYQGVDGKYYAGENIEDVKEPVVEGVPNNSSNSSNSEAEIKNNPYGRASDVGTNYYYSRTGKTIFGGTPVKAIQWALKDMGYNPGSIDGAYGGGTSSAVKAFQRAVGISADGDYGPDTREQFRLKGYNRGGLADFTGPAWLDGTKARPEIVLDAQDSRNFIQLRDILGSLLNRGSTSSTSTENNGDITYDIDINVESIGNDYDVEQMANKVKNLIGEDARYRNNNAVSLKK